MPRLQARIERSRRTASLVVRNRALLRLLIRSSHRVGLGPLVTPQTFELASGRQELRAGQREYEDGPRFFRHLGGTLVPQDLAGLDVLDLGCGYGGRSIYYARDCGARSVEGLEISAEMVERCEALARRMEVGNATFSIGVAEDLPYEDAAFDVVTCFDVLEHVADPRVAIAETARILRPGGTAWLVFPSYRGLRASHLDYLTMLPALHRVFDPDVVVEVVNEFLRAEPDRYGTAIQPEPRTSALGHLTLPTLNGMTRAEAHAAVAASGLLLVREELTPLVVATVPVPGAAAAEKVLVAVRDRVGLPEMLVGTIALTVQRPPRPVGGPRAAP